MPPKCVKADAIFPEHSYLTMLKTLVGLSKIVLGYVQSYWLTRYWSWGQAVKYDLLVQRAQPGRERPSSASSQGSDLKADFGLWPVLTSSVSSLCATFGWVTH